MADIRRSRIITAALAIACLVALAVPVAQRLDAPYEHNYHGHLTAWFALMSQNMAESGFVETRFMPVINPNPAELEQNRFYLTHPVLDVVLRAGLVKAFGPHEWVMRLQGLIGCFGAALIFYFICRRWFRPVACLAASCGMAAMPLFQRLAHLSMQHPMTLFCAMAGLLFYLRYREKGRKFDLIGLFFLLFCGMQFDWPGYFMPLLIWVAEIFGPRRRSIVTGLPCLAVAALGLVWVHVNYIVGDPRGLVQTLLDSTSRTGLELTTREALNRILEIQRYGFGPVGLALGGLAALGCVLFRPSRKFLLLWFAALLYGALHCLVFWGKAPEHDFWGCYWLPWAGLSFGILAELICGVFDRISEPRGEFALQGLVVGLTVAAVFLLEWDEGAARRGREHKEYAQQILEIIDEKDRGVFITNYTNKDFMLLGAYLRVNIVSVANLRPKDLPLLPQMIQRDFFHARGLPCLFFVAPTVDTPEDEIRMRGLTKELRDRGTLYKGIGGIWEVTDFIWG